jgi:uncharacterized repeat protein (TIGR03847 family)
VMQLGHDATHNLLVLFLQGPGEDDQEDEPPAELRLWLRPGQLRALGEQARDVAGKGRPLCPLCQRPIDPEGHFCPGGNGHSKKVAEY